MGRAGRAILLLLSALVALPATAQNAQLTIQPDQVRPGGRVTIRVQLEDQLTGAPVPQPPTRNLRIVSGPSSSSEFRWINGRFTRRKSLEWTAEAGSPGLASAGPLTLADGARRITLEAATVTVLPESVADAADGRPQRLTLVAEISSREVFVGEQVSVTWALVSDDTLRDVRIVESASFEGFWAEELSSDERYPRTVWEGGRERQYLPLRRVVLFPLQTGVLPIRPMRVEADVLVPTGDTRSPFAFFEGRIETLEAASRPLTVRVREAPGGAQVTGATSIGCSPAVVSPAGIVTRDVTITSTGNLRLATPPEFVTPPQARVEIEQTDLRILRASEPVRTSRSWRFMLFPERPGRLEVPPMLFRAWDPDAGAARELRCAAASMVIPERSGTGLTSPGASDSGDDSSGRAWRALAAAAGLAGASVVAALLFARRRGRRDHHRDEVRSLIAGMEEPRERRKAIEQWLRDAGIDPYVTAWAETPLGERWREVLALLESEQRSPLSERDDDELLRRLDALAEERDRR